MEWQSYGISSIRKKSIIQNSLAQELPLIGYLTRQQIMEEFS